MTNPNDFDLLMSLLGYRYVERDVSLDKSDIGGMYTEHDCYARAPFPVQRYPEADGTHVTKYVEDNVWRGVCDYDTQDKAEQLNSLDFLFRVLDIVQKEHLHTSTMGGAPLRYWVAIHPQARPGVTAKGEGTDMAEALRVALVAFAQEAEMELPAPNYFVPNPEA